MTKEAIIQHNAADYNIAIQTIKEAILRINRQKRVCVNFVSHG